MAVVLSYSSCFPGLIGRNANHLEMWLSEQDVETMCLWVVFHWRVNGMFSVECGTVELCYIKALFKLYMGRKNVFIAAY